MSEGLASTVPCLQDQHPPLRLLEPIGNIPPAEAEARYYAQSDELAMVA